MALSLSAEQKEVLKVFKVEEQYIIPAYQRPYSWSEDQCMTLYNDIFEAFKKDEDYFIGNLIIAKNIKEKEKLEVIDGQQRLTTLLLFIKLLSLYLPEHKALKQALEIEDWESDKTIPRIKSLVFESNDEKELNKVLIFTSLENIKELKNIKKLNKFEQNILYFYNYIEFFNSKNLDLKEFIKFLLQRVFLLPIELGGNTPEDASEKALKIFETINDRGMSLYDADIFKSKLYEKAKKINDEKRFIQGWRDLREECEIQKVSFDDIFRYYSHIIRGSENKTNSEINLREFFTTLDYSPFNTKNYDEILDDLFKITNALKFYNEEMKKSSSTAKWLQLINIYSNQYPKIATIVYLSTKSLDNKESLENFLIKLVRYVYYKGSTTSVKFEIYNIIRNVCLDYEISSYTYEVSENDFNYSGSLKNAYALLAFYLTRDKSLSEYSIDKLLTYKDEKFLPLEWTKNQIEEVNNRLGNLVILDIAKKSITLDKKVIYYKNSKLLSVLELSETLNNFTKYIFDERDLYCKTLISNFIRGKNDKQN